MNNQDIALEKIATALKEYIMAENGDELTEVTGIILQASTSGVMSGERLIFFEEGNMVTRMGLLGILEVNINESVFEEE